MHENLNGKNVLACIDGQIGYGKLYVENNRLYILQNFASGYTPRKFDSKEFKKSWFVDQEYLSIKNGRYLFYDGAFFLRKGKGIKTFFSNEEGETFSSCGVKRVKKLPIDEISEFSKKRLLKLFNIEHWEQFIYWTETNGEVKTNVLFPDAPNFDAAYAMSIKMEKRIGSLLTTKKWSSDTIEYAGTSCWRNSTDVVHEICKFKAKNNILTFNGSIGEKIVAKLFPCAVSIPVKSASSGNLITIAIITDQMVNKLKTLIH